MNRSCPPIAKSLSVILTSAEHAAPAIVFEGLSVRRGRTAILADVCATVPRGGSTVLVGPNGAGKTTLLLCLIGAFLPKAAAALPGRVWAMSPSNCR